MSYILDALKKSEQERGRGDIPGVQTVHSSSLNYHGQKKTYWPYFLIMAVLLNLAAIIYFIVDKEQAAPAQVATQPVTTSEVASEATHQPMDSLPAQNEKVVNENMINEISSHQQAGTQSPSEQAIAPMMTGPEPVTKPATRPAAKAAPLIAEKQVIEFYELPAAIKQQLPAIVISAHVYSSNPLQRSIVINNNFMEEGEYVIDELRLHEITPDGAIFDFRETRFHHGVVSSWQ